MTWGKQTRGHTTRVVVRLLRLLDGRRYMPHMTFLARELGICKRSVYRYLNEVEAAGWRLPKRWRE